MITTSIFLFIYRAPGLSFYITPGCPGARDHGNAYSPVLLVALNVARACPVAAVVVLDSQIVSPGYWST